MLHNLRSSLRDSQKQTWISIRARRLLEWLQKGTPPAADSAGFGLDREAARGEMSSRALRGGLCSSMCAPRSKVCVRVRVLCLVMLEDEVVEGNRRWVVLKGKRLRLTLIFWVLLKCRDLLLPVSMSCVYRGTWRKGTGRAGGGGGGLWWRRVRG